MMDFASKGAARTRCAAVQRSVDGAENAEIALRNDDFLLKNDGFCIKKGQQGLEPAVLAAFTRKFDEESPSVWRDLKKNPWEIDKAIGGPSGDLMIPGTLLPISEQMVCFMVDSDKCS